MVSDKTLESTLLRNLQWFERSGVMSPSDGSWGVGERVVLTAGNGALDRIYTEFPCYTAHEGYSILEHRRADCNFQVAWLYYCVSRIFEDPRYRVICRNILGYLFHRSGMRCVKDEVVPIGLWRWSTPQWKPTYWMDDNAWNCMVCLLLSQDPELNREFGLRQAGKQIADAMVRDIDEIMVATLEAPPRLWEGDPQSPHWGSLFAMALACAHAVLGKQEYAICSEKYLQHLETLAGGFTASEEAYHALGITYAAGCLGSEKLLDCARKWNDRLVCQQRQYGHFPSQWRETAAGEDYVDTIYTQNWATLSLQLGWQLFGEPRYGKALEKSLALLCEIQDRTPQDHLKGCWRGLYDLRNQCWGGGDRYEGGANSIYTGWTNAPIVWVIAMELGRTSLLPPARCGNVLSRAEAGS